MACSISNTLVIRQTVDVFGNIGLNFEGTGSPGDQMLLIFAWSRSLLTKNWKYHQIPPQFPSGP